MFRIGDRVRVKNSDTTGLLVSYEAGDFTIRQDGSGQPLVISDVDALELADSAQARSYPADPVHQAMLRHARNAGAAVTALEIIRREAKQALDGFDSADWQAKERSLNFIEKFASDVLSQVLPA